MVLVFTDSSSSCSSGRCLDSISYSSFEDGYTVPPLTRNRAKARITCKSCNQRCLGKIVQTISTDQSDDSNCVLGADRGVTKPRASFYHVSCFVCSVCSISLSRNVGDETGYFERSGRLFCPKHYQILFGEKCTFCNNYLSGQTLSVFGKQFHKNCLVCNGCGSQIEANERISNFASFSTGGNVLCNKCSKMVCNEDNFLSISLRCAGCNGDQLDNASTVLAMGYCFHAWCFKCTSCRTVLDGLYFYDEQSKTQDSFSPNLIGNNRTQRPSALCFDCYFAKSSISCHCCKDIIAPSEKRLEICHYDPVVKKDRMYSYHPNCAKCHRCLLWFVDGEKVYIEKPKVGLQSQTDAHFVHEDCGKSKSREFLKSCNITLRQDQQDNYANVRRFLKSSSFSRIGSSGAACVRRSWAAPATGTSPAEIYLPKTAQLYRSTYLDPKDLNSSGACINSSLYCRFRSSECAVKSKEEKMISYQGLKFHDERSIDVGALYTDKGVRIYPKEVLFTMNKALPKGVNRCNLESHLSESDFFLVFQMGREEFYKLPEWKRTFLKKLHNLF